MAMLLMVKGGKIACDSHLFHLYPWLSLRLFPDIFKTPNSINESKEVIDNGRTKNWLKGFKEWEKNAVSAWDSSLNKM